MYEILRKKTAAGILGLLAVAMFFTPAAGAVSGVRAQSLKLIPIGHTVGIRMNAQGVLVVGLTTADGGENSPSPAREAGVKAGDVLCQIDDVALESAAQLQQLVQRKGEQQLTLKLRRGNKTHFLSVQAIQDAEGVYHLGAWVRDSIAGIGTVTFYDPETGILGTLGHGITDNDTAQLLPFGSGALMASSVKGVKKGVSGSPGELRGDFDQSRDLGELFANTSCGVFGTVDSCPWMEEREAIEVAEKEELRTGRATILSNISGDQVREYQVEIEKLCLSGGNRNMILRVVDPQLLEATGGIVQGMSGSPILQNGKLVGAVTHVLVNDPSRGYGIFIGNMLDMAYWEEAENVS